MFPQSAVLRTIKGNIKILIAQIAVNVPRLIYICSYSCLRLLSHDSLTVAPSLKGQCFNVRLDNGLGINDADANAGCCAPKTKDDGTNSVDVDRVDPYTHQKTHWWDNILDSIPSWGDYMNQRLQQPKLVPEKKEPSSSIDSDPDPVASVPEVPLADFSDTTPNVATPNPFGDSSSIVAAPINNGNTYIAGLPALSSDDLFSGDAYAEPLPHFPSASSPGTSPGQGSSESYDAPA